MYIYIHTKKKREREKDRKLLKLYLMKKENPRRIREGCKTRSPGSNSRNSQHESLICEDVGNSC